MPQFVIDSLCTALTRKSRRSVSRVREIDLTRSDTAGTAFAVTPNDVGFSDPTPENIAYQIAGLLSPGKQVEVEVLPAPEEYERYSEA